MSAAADQTNDQARSAAREFLARLSRETGEAFSPVVVDHILFAYEMGFLRGHGNGMRAAGALYDELERKVTNESK